MIYDNDIKGDLGLICDAYIFDNSDIIADSYITNDNDIGQLYQL